ncbi:hypothetical protein [Sagittula stellata]|uniref:TRAP-type C4-dicarboxylate transport system, periplasmic component n=1 Tax=Sagittula stellata (strain ATCC 700073 / DSM 11524 / E-37) TaxID=388399 RepID=A3JY99_SAGS3|nr:hypothetical protein [Sagittula stellata]EBA10485.1 TRAP-type C4-dicarboxylate transport system, periplasmic component [Sagittula stellata E-37]
MSPSLTVDEVTGSHTDAAGDKSLHNLFFIPGRNKHAYDSLPDDLKAVIDPTSGPETAAREVRTRDTGAAEGRAVMEA